MDDVSSVIARLTGSENPLWQWALCAVVFFVFLLLSRLYRYKAVAVILKFAKRLRGTSWEELLRALSRPVAALLLLVGATFALWNLPLSAAVMAPLRAFLTKALRLVSTGLIGWAGCGIVDTVPVFEFKFLGSAEAVRAHAAPGGESADRRLCGAGDAGDPGLPGGQPDRRAGPWRPDRLAGRKDTASNLFAGLVLLVEKPFAIGDWVTCAGVEGAVEDITFRSTKIRTLANTLTVVPNSVVSAGLISNGSERKMRMAEFTIGVCYDTPRAALEQVMADLRALLTGDAAVRADTVVVRFTGFSASSMDVLVRYYTKTTDYNEFLAVGERLNLAILDLMASNGVSFAFPSTTVYLEDGGKGRPLNPQRSSRGQPRRPDRRPFHFKKAKRSIGTKPGSILRWTRALFFKILRPWGRCGSRPFTQATVSSTSPWGLGAAAGRVRPPYPRFSMLPTFLISMAMVPSGLWTNSKKSVFSA